MTEKLLDIIRAKHELSPLEVGEFVSLKAKGMRFSIRAFRAEGLGHVSVMRARGFFGLMRMDTLMIVPEQKDLPLYSYDRIHAMGNDTLIIELYDTTVKNNLDMSMLDRIKASFRDLPERYAGEHWYDDIRLRQSISKKAKRDRTQELDTLALEHLGAFINVRAPEITDISEKRERSAGYVRGLLAHGGPSTDVFKKELGAEATERLFKNVLFGVG